MRVLVTGGAGFIGSNITEGLIRKGYEIRVLDNLFMGSLKNLEMVKDKIEIVQGDLRDEKLLKEITNDVDFILNQAAASSSPMFKKDIKSSVAVNVEGFINVLEAARINNVKRVVYASTSSIYGNSPPPLREDMKVEPPNFYAATKFMNEHLALLYSQEYGLETVGLRYMSVYGPHEESKTIFANLASQFLWAMKKGEEIVIYGDGEQTRDFTFVEDVVAANILSMEAKLEKKGEIFNVGTGIAVSLNEMIKILNRLLSKNVKPKYVDIPVKNYIKTQRADISKIRKIGFEPKFSLEDGLKRLIG